MPINFLLTVLISFFLGIVFEGTLRRLALRYNILTPKGIPLIGGIGIGLSFSITCLILFRNLSKEAIGLLFSAFIILIFGIVDDCNELSIWAKLLTQIVAITLLVFFGIKTQIIFFGTILNLIITFIWVLAITNAFNHLDIMDGLAASMAIIVSFGFFVISFLNSDFKTAILSLALTGATTGFLIYNLPPAKIYMGNSGSHFLGFSLAAIALAISYAPLERKIALLTPLLILGLPIFDTVFLVLMRISKRRLPFKKSNDHIALRFLKSRHSKNKTLLFMLLMCLFFCLCGIAVSRVSNHWGIGTIILAMLVSLVITIKMSKVAVND